MTMTPAESRRGPRLAANYYLAPPEMTVAEFMGHAKTAGAEGVGLTVAALNAQNPERLASLADDNGLFISSLNSAGYFLSSDAARRADQDDLNRRLIDAAMRMKAHRLVVITGGILEYGKSLEVARARVLEGLAALDRLAGETGISLALEPVHPADLTIKGCVNSIAQALQIVSSLPSTEIVVDAFHSAWDPDIWRLSEIANDKLAFIQACNWYEPSADEKPQRDLPDAGLMDLCKWLVILKTKGFRGTIEFEMFDRHRRGRSVEYILNSAIRCLKSYLLV